MPRYQVLLKDGRIAEVEADRGEIVQHDQPGGPKMGDVVFYFGNKLVAHFKRNEISGWHEATLPEVEQS